MKHPLLTRDLLQAIRDSTTNKDTEVSLKCRIAVFDTPDDMTGDKLSEEQYQTLHKYIEQAHEGGISHLVLHARAAVLSGLSPTKNRQVPALDYETVQRVSRNFPRVRVTLNGGISGMPRFTKIADTSSANGVSSFMAGRWMLRRPLDLARIQSHFSEEPDSPNDERDSNTSNSGSVVQAVEQYSSYLKQCVQQPSSKQSHFPTLSDLCLPLYMISEQLREDYEEEDDLSDNDTSSERWLKDADIESIYDTIRDTVAWLQEERGAKKTKFSASSIQFKKLSSSFKGLVGTKVANKWKRNRVEL
jgi:tRNA-dihydrouridine synthase